MARALSHPFDQDRPVDGALANFRAFLAGDGPRRVRRLAAWICCPGRPLRWRVSRLAATSATARRRLFIYELVQKMQEMKAKCDADPAKCEEKKKEWREKRQEN